MAPGWAHPEWLADLAAVLLGTATLLLAARGLARRRLRRLLGGTPRIHARTDAALLLALALIGASLLGPRLGVATLRVPATGIDLVLLFDLSRSMDATDVAPSRLARAREAARAVLSGLRDGDRAALAAFADHGALLTPLTPDPSALAELLPGLDSNLMSDTGSRLGAGLGAALGAFGSDLVRPRVMLVLSDGEGSKSVPEEVLRKLSRADVRVVSVALGTEAGSEIPEQGGPLRDDRGAVVHSRRERAGLERLATATGGALLLADAWGGVDPRALRAELRRGARPSGAGSMERTLPVTRHSALALLALLVLLGEALPAGALRRLAARATGRRALLRNGAAALLLCLATVPAQPEPLDTGTAGERLPSATWLLAVGMERAGGGELEEATRAFRAAVARAADASEGALAYYDLGVAYLEQRELEAARDAFFDALALDRHDRQARFNLEWTLRALAATPPPPDRQSHQNEHPNPRKSKMQPRAQQPAAKPRDASRSDSQPAHPRPTDERTGATQPWPRAASLDPDQVRHWLDAVKDDPRAALRGAARRGTPQHRNRQVRW